jgi:hypothetical protein
VNISVERFLYLTAMLATSVTLASGCVSEDKSDDREDDTADTGGSGGGGSDEGEAGAEATAGSEQGGSTSGDAGAEATAGSEQGGSTSGDAGAEATAGTEQGGSTSGDAGAAGRATGGESAAGAGGDEGGAGTTGAPGGATAGGAAGATGAAGASGATCVSGDPAEEGGGFDCTTLPYAAETCPDPTGEGLTVVPRGVQICQVFSADRAGSVQVLTDCLAEIEAGTDGYCGDEHAAAVDACVTEMLDRTCISEVATSACEAINTECEAVDVADCEQMLSTQGDAEITSYIQSCASDPAVPDSACEYNYRSCVGLPNELLQVSEVCAAVQADCPALDLATCESRLDYYLTGVIYESSYYYGVVGCMETEQAGGAACEVAFDTCNP